MYIVKRTKSPPPGNEPPGPPAVHYATSAAPEGNVTGWTADAAGAAQFGEDACARIAAYYGGRPTAGKVEFGRADQKAVAPAARERPDDQDMRDAVAEIDRQRMEIGVLRRKLDDATADALKWQAEAEAARQELDAATAPTGAPTDGPTVQAADSPPPPDRKRGRDRRAEATAAGKDQQGE